jgi:adenylate cyclase
VAELTLDELASAAGTSVREVRRLVKLGLVPTMSPGRFPSSAIEHVRLAMAIDESGIPLPAVGKAVASGRLSFDIVDLMFPVPVGVASESVQDFAARIGLAEHDVRRLYVAFGLAQPLRADTIRTDDAHVIGELVRLLATPETRPLLKRLARLLGQPMRQMTDAGTQLYDEVVIQPIASSDRSGARAVEERADEIAADLVMMAPHVLQWLFRRHLEQTLLGYWTANAEQVLGHSGGARGRDHTIAFIDLSGFTAITEAVGDAEASRLSERLTDLGEERAAPLKGRIVKQLGDGIMLHFGRTQPPVEGVLDLVVAVSDAGLPAAHVGMAAGPVIERDGDYYGRTVNLASRLADVADAGQVVVNERIASMTAAGIRFEPLGTVALQGMAPEPAFVARREE